MTQRPDRGFLDGFNTVWGKQRSRAAHPPQQRNTATSQGTPSPTYRAETSKKRDGSPSSETPVEGPKGEAQQRNRRCHWADVGRSTCTNAVQRCNGDQRAISEAIYLLAW